MPEFDDHWLLPLEDYVVTRCCVDFALTNLFVARREDGSDSSAEIRIGGEFVFRAADGRRSAIHPAADPGALGPVFEILWQAVTRAVAFKDGALELWFSNQSSLRVEFDSHYEAWEYNGRSPSKIISLPGGELAVWD